MSEKVLGFYEKDAGITCAECYCVYCNEAKCPNPDCGEINKEDIITFNRSELVPVRLRKESVDLKWLEDLIKKEWKEHKENWDESGKWFECSNVENDVYNNYAVGASITTTCSNGQEKTIILKTKKETDEYTRKMKKKYAGCSVCDRFRTLLCAVRAKAKGV